MVDGYVALATTERDAVAAALVEADLVAVAVSRATSRPWQHRWRQGWRSEPPNVPMRVGYPAVHQPAHAAPSFRATWSGPPADLRAYGDRQIGVVETLVIRWWWSYPPRKQRVTVDVWTNGYADSCRPTGLSGNHPDLSFVRPVPICERGDAQLFTYNTYHAALAYLGALRGHITIMACIEDLAVSRRAEGALAESRAAVQAGFGFGDGEMDRWVEGVLSQTANPALGDTVARFAADPLRKLRRGDRLVGPLLLAHECGIATPYLDGRSPRRCSTTTRRTRVRAPCTSASRRWGYRRVSLLCELAPYENPLVDSIAHAYTRLQRETAWAEKARRGAALGTISRRPTRVWSCAVAALLDTLETLDPCVGDALFEAATGVAGGLGLSGDAACGALTGSSLVFGALYPRRRAHFGGDRENKYRTYGMVQQLRQRYLEAYGGITCHDVHRSIFGRAFDLQDPQDRVAFEAAGAHEDKCTGVVARAVRWAIEIIAEERMATDELPLDAEAART